MAIDISGQEKLPQSGLVTVAIAPSHPLIQLAQALPWVLLMDLVVKDIKATTKKGCWWMGRKIKVRIHLGAYLLQRLYNLTDRRLEYQLRDNAAFQVFSGLNIVDGWHAPDHTKIEEFRNRLSPETHQKIANSLAQCAVAQGFADPREVDFDSTVQEANISYPSDASLMSKLAGYGKKLVDYMRSKFPEKIQEGLDIDIKAIKTKVREYFFLPKNKSIDIKRAVFKDLHKLVKNQLKPIIKICDRLSEEEVAQLPWNIRRTFHQIKTDGWRYLLDVAHFTRTHTIKAGKILSFHAKALSCISKGKIGKPFEFGRIFQLGRLKGNFLFVLESTCVSMNDKQSFVPLIHEHARLFGENILETVATDKGYWSKSNLKEIESRKKCTEGLQRPSKSKAKIECQDQAERLRNRRAGIEPLIGHAKGGGQLRRSRMKSDKATLAAGYGSILGLNLRQFIRHQKLKEKVAA